MANFTLTAFIDIPEQSGYYYPDRHFADIGRKSLYSHMIGKLEAIPEVGTIIINTDSPRIRNDYDRNPKMKVINVYQHEPMEIEMELTSDKVTAAMIPHAQGEHFLQMGAIFPFLRQSTVGQVVEYYDRYVVNPEDRPFDSVFTIKTLNRRYYDSDADLIREDRPNTFVEDGMMHVFNRTAFFANGGRKVGKRPFAFGVQEIENLAIESQENLVLAQYIADNRHRFPEVFR